MTKKNYPKKLSIIVISTCHMTSLENCLSSIFANETLEKIEIIVAVCDSENLISDLTKKFPTVDFIQFREKVGIPILAAAGIEKSRGEIIALTDSACVVDKNWIASIMRAHQSDLIIFGGAVEPFGKMKSLDLAAYFCEYGRFMPPLKSGVTEVLPGNNFSFKRSALKIGREFTEPKFWKTFWCERLQKENIKLILNTEITVYYARKFSPASFLVRRFQHGRCFAGMRIQPAAVSKRLFYISGSIFLPFIFFYRIVSVVPGKKRFVKEFIRASPFILLAVLSWSLGEFCGYLAGTGKSCDYID